MAFPATGPHGPVPWDEVVVGDTETTGLAPFGLRDGEPSGDPDGPDRLCSLALVRLARRGGSWARTGSALWVANPGRPVP